MHGTPAVILSGRAHPYEGYSQRESTLLLRAILALGARTVVLTNAAGGLDPDYEPGDVMLISDHLNLSGDNPLRGPNLDRFGDALPGHDRRLRPVAPRRGSRVGCAGRPCPARGVYIMLTGPSFETQAEMRMLRGLGGDAVGMSTAHETIVARHAGARVLGFSLITNKATEDVQEGATHEEVLEVGRIGAERLVPCWVTCCRASADPDRCSSSSYRPPSSRASRWRWSSGSPSTSSATPTWRTSSATIDRGRWGA